MKYSQQPIPYQHNLSPFIKSLDTMVGCVFETSQTSSVYQSKTRFGYHPVLEICGSEMLFELRLSHVSAEPLFNFIAAQFNISPQNATLQIPLPQRSEVLDALFHLELNAEYAGFYGAFGYEYITAHYPVKRHIESSDTPDIHFFLFGSVYVFDHHTQSAVLETCLPHQEKIPQHVTYSRSPLTVSSIRVCPEESDFKNQVQSVIELCAKGEIFEGVLARKFTAEISGNLSEFYSRYKKTNPSPYNYFYNFGDYQIVGTSPEMMVRIADGVVESRPISGTAPRSSDPFEDHLLQMNLLNSEKEKSELDMLIDLARNDLSRVCEPGLQISDYRAVEKYSKVMHTVAHLSGKLRKDKSVLDAFKATLNAGTLTGAPKVAAMNIIAEIETFSRKFYGGAIGYIGLNGDADTAILIRSAYIKNHYLEYLSGVTVLFDSTPEGELEESKHKAEAFMELLSNLTENYTTSEVFKTSEVF